MPCASVATRRNWSSRRTRCPLTGFRDGDVNLHYLHVNREEKGRTCRTCHEMHGSDLPNHMASGVPVRGLQLGDAHPVCEKRQRGKLHAGLSCGARLSARRDDASDAGRGHHETIGNPCPDCRGAAAWPAEPDERRSGASASDGDEADGDAPRDACRGPRRDHRSPRPARPGRQRGRCPKRRAPRRRWRPRVAPRPTATRRSRTTRPSTGR